MTFLVSNAKSVEAVPFTRSVYVHALVKQRFYDFFVAPDRGFQKRFARVEDIVAPCIDVRKVFLEEYTDIVRQTMTAVVAANSLADRLTTSTWVRRSALIQA